MGLMGLSRYELGLFTSGYELSSRTLPCTFASHFTRRFIRPFRRHVDQRRFPLRTVSDRGGLWSGKSTVWNGSDGGVDFLPREF